MSISGNVLFHVIYNIIERSLSTENFLVGQVFCLLIPGVSPFFTSKEILSSAKKILVVLPPVNNLLRAGRPASGRA